MNGTFVPFQIEEKGFNGIKLKFQFGISNLIFKPKFQFWIWNPILEPKFELPKFENVRGFFDMNSIYKVSYLWQVF